MEKIKAFLAKIPKWVSPAVATVAWLVAYSLVLDLLGKPEYASVNTQSSAWVHGFMSALLFYLLIRFVGGLSATGKAIAECATGRKVTGKYPGKK